MTPWIIACQTPLSLGFPRQEYWSGLPFHPPGESSQPRDRTHICCIAGRFFTTETLLEKLSTLLDVCSNIQINLCLHSFPHIFSSSGPGHLSPASISAARAQFRLVGLFESESHFVIGEPMRSLWVWLSWDYPWGRVYTCVCMCMYVCLSVVLLRTSSQLIWQEIEVLRVISKQFTMNILNIKKK